MITTMAVSQGKMLGRYTRGQGGYKCSCCQDPDTTRWRKRTEQRQLEREFAAWASWYDSDEGRDWLERELAEAEGWPGWDFSDCQHGCSGSPSCGEPCTFVCHENVGTAP
jgi:hypothetical protein